MGTKEETIEYEITEEGGVSRYRVPAAKNDHNPDGVTLDCVLQEFRAAERPTIDSAVSEAYARQLVAKRRDAPEGSQPIVTRDGRTVPWDGDFSKLGGLLEQNEIAISPSDDWLVRIDDDERAKFIKDHPTSLLLLDEYRDAISRWSYGRQYASEKSVKDRAKSLIKHATGASRGTPPRHRFDSDQVNTALADLTTYVNLLTTCYESVGEKDVHMHFRDCEELEDPMALMKWNGTYLRQYGLPSASDVTEGFFQYHFGYSPSQLYRIKQR